MCDLLFIYLGQTLKREYDLISSPLSVSTLTQLIFHVMFLLEVGFHIFVFYYEL